MLKKLWILPPLVLGLIMTLSASVSAQGDAVVVPNLTGLSIPVAAALLNRTGLNLGGEKTVIWTDSSTIPKDKISGQSVAPGQQIARGTAVEVTVLRAANVELLYDYNSLTLINKTGQPLDLSDVTLNAFAARSWPQKVLDNGQCAQIWAITHNGPQSSTECPSVRTWFFNTNKALHFWRGTSGNAQFSFVKKEIQYGTCSTVNPDSPSMRCDLFVAGDTPSEATEYLYFAYTSDQLVLRNRSKELWMPLSRVSVINDTPAPARIFPIGDPNAYPNRPNIGQVDRLAPNQCLWFTVGDVQNATPVEDCDSIAQLATSPEQAFWAADFRVDGVLDDQIHICPKATPGKLTVCMVPR
jgi:hypothetical protein